jgi:UDP-N-acetylglucosamine 3-dehydrogenase
MRTKAGIIGFAHTHACDYAGTLGQLSDVEFVGVTDEDADRGSLAADRYGVPFIEDAGELLSGADAVVVCSESRDHARFTIEALERGVHVLCEQPIATTLDDALRMVDAGNKSEAELRIAFPARYRPAVRRAKRAIENDALGRIIAVTATYHCKVPRGRFTELEAAAGGAIVDSAGGVVDLLRWMFGTEIESVYAETGPTFGDGGVESSVILTLELEGGAFATIDPNWSRGGGLPGGGEVALGITGTRGVIELDAFTPSATIFGYETGSNAQLSLDEDTKHLMLEDFLTGLRNGSPGGAKAVDGLRALEVALAARRSSRSCAPERLERTEDDG